MARRAVQYGCKSPRRRLVSTLSEVRRLNKTVAKSEDFRVKMFGFQFRMNLMSFLVVLISGFDSVYRKYRLAIEWALNSLGICPILLLKGFDYSKQV